MANKESFRDEKELSGEGNFVISESRSKRLIRWVNPDQGLVLSVKNSQFVRRNNNNNNNSNNTTTITNKDSIFIKTTQGLEEKEEEEYRIITKPIVNLDEKYLRRCLDLIHSRASTMARCNEPEKTTGFLLENLSHLEPRIGDGFDPARLVFECQVVGESGDSVVIGPATTGQWILGSVMGSKSMTNILKSPLLLFHHNQQHVHGGAVSEEDRKNNTAETLSNFSSFSSVSSSPIRAEKSARTGEVSKHDNRASVSSSNSNSDRGIIISQAMIQCSWRPSGVPRFVFSADDHKEIFVAELRNAESRDDKALDYVYSFHRGESLVGKMKVSNTFTISADDGSETVETEFILFGTGCETETQPSNHLKHKGFPRKMVDAFRSSKTTVSKFSGPCSIQEDFSLDDHGDFSSGHEFYDDCHSPSLEIAAIVVRDRIVSAQTEEIEPSGGWGLKFLKKVGVKRTKNSTECDNRSSGDCSTSVDILIPMGLHGGPKTRNGGPSSLTDRWKSSGKCDCGGWDLGCPLTILKPRPNKDNDEEEFKSFDFTTQGSDHGSPTLRLVTVQDDLYFVHFQRTLSILQSFSIAVAVIHTRSPNLRPRDVHGLK